MSGNGRNVIQEMGVVAVVLMMISNAWLLIANINQFNAHDSSLKHIEGTRFTVTDGKELRKLIESLH